MHYNKEDQLKKENSSLKAYKLSKTQYLMKTLWFLETRTDISGKTEVELNMLSVFIAKKIKIWPNKVFWTSAFKTT